MDLDDDFVNDKPDFEESSAEAKLEPDYNSPITPEIPSKGGSKRHRKSKRSAKRTRKSKKSRKTKRRSVNNRKKRTRRYRR